MRRKLTLVAILAAAAAWLAAGGGSTRSPILVELFTSEGCSSCPPADRMLEQLDPQVVVLSEHVDYWDHDGWKDPFSSHLNTARQQQYSQRFHLDGVYTPQMVVDGAAEFTGNDAARATKEIAKSGQRRKAQVRLSRTGAGLRVEIGEAPGPGGVFLALAEDNRTSQVTGGENGGRSLHHVAILRSLRKLGSVKRGGGFDHVITLPPGAGQQRIIVFVQDGDAGPVLGAGELGPEA